MIFLLFLSSINLFPSRRTGLCLLGNFLPISPFLVQTRPKATPCLKSIPSQQPSRCPCIGGIWNSGRARLAFKWPLPNPDVIAKAVGNRSRPIHFIPPSRESPSLILAKSWSWSWLQWSAVRERACSQSGFLSPSRCRFDGSLDEVENLVFFHKERTRRRAMHVGLGLRQAMWHSSCLPACLPPSRHR